MMSLALKPIPAHKTCENSKSPTSLYILHCWINHGHKQQPLYLIGTHQHITQICSSHGLQNAYDETKLLHGLLDSTKKTQSAIYFSRV